MIEIHDQSAEEREQQANGMAFDADRLRYSVSPGELDERSLLGHALSLERDVRRQPDDVHESTGRCLEQRYRRLVLCGGFIT